MKHLFFSIPVLFLFAAETRSQSTNDQAGLKAWGVKINVTDMGKALRFYRDILHFSASELNSDSNTLLLKPVSGEGNILLHKVSYLLPVGNNESTATLTLQVNNVDSSILLLKNKAIDFGSYELRKEGVGYATYLDDPFGTRLSLMQETVTNPPPFGEPCIYNYGFYIPDIMAGKQFYQQQLGFVTRSEKYLPLDLPMGHRDGSFAFMLHTRNGVRPIHYNAADNEHIVIIFEVADAEKCITFFKNNNIRVAKDSIESLAEGKVISFYDPFGYVSQVIEFRK